MDKRGLSSIITTVLIILLAIIAIAVFWVFVSPMFTKGGGEISKTESCLTMNLAVKCIVNKDSASVSVIKNSGGEDINAMKLIFYKENGEAETFATTRTQREFETQFYNVAVGFKAKNVSLVVGILKDGKMGYCNPTNKFVCLFLYQTENSPLPNWINVITKEPENNPTTYAISVTKAGTGAGTIASNPAGITCAGTTCSGNFNVGTPVTLTATPDAPNIFAGWGGDCSSFGIGTCTLTTTGSATATFNAKLGLSGYAANKQLQILGAASAQTDYQMKLVIHKTTGTDNGPDVYVGDKVLSDYKDIRFTKSDGILTLIPYWIESYDNNYATVWIKVDSIPAGPAITTIYMYFGNPTETTSLSNPTSTLWYYNDFEGDVVGQLPSGVQTTTNLVIDNVGSGQQGTKYAKNTADFSTKFNMPNIYNSCLNAKLKHISCSPSCTYQRLGYVSRWDSTNSLFGGVWYANNILDLYENSNRMSFTSLTWGTSWHDMEIKLFENSAWVKLDTTTVSSSLLVNTNQGVSGMRTWAGSLDAFDYIRIRKYVNPEPTWQLPLSTTI